MCGAVVVLPITCCRLEKCTFGRVRLSYSEYLVNIINKNGLDPVTIYELGQIKAMLLREEMEVPDQEDDEDEEQYREKRIEVD